MRRHLLLSLIAATAGRAAEPRNFSGIYPHLAMFNNEGECGTGAVVPWADRLWVITYGPHLPNGSSDKLYEIDPALSQVIRPESVGGTPANRMIHPESQQLFIGPYVIDKTRNVRVIPPAQMFGRLTGMARHVTDPAGKVCYATMEEGFYEVDVKTLAVTELWVDEQRKTGRHADLPGYHGKGFHSTSDRYIYANNGDHSKAALSDPATPSGVLAEWDGKADKWTVVRRNQFTDVTSPDGIEGGARPGHPVWSIGWDHRSLILMMLDAGKWHSFRLPKASHCYDGAHGWNTEWPRIREIGEDSLLMTMHGEFWKFPRTFSAADTSGIAPRSTYLKVIGDFCRWGERVVLGCDDTAKSEFLNKDRLKGSLAAPGISQSNLWFVAPSRLDQCGPPLGRGAVWLDDAIKAGVASEPFLFAGFAHRSLHLAHDSAEPVNFAIEVDSGDGKWTKLRDVSVPAHGTEWTEFSAKETGAWVRLTADRDCAKVTAFFHYRAADPRGTQSAAMFDGLAGVGDTAVNGGTLLAHSNRKLLFFATNPKTTLGPLEAEGLTLDIPSETRDFEKIAGTVAIRPPVVTSAGASVLYVDSAGKRWRLPKGDPAFDHPGPLGEARLCREVSTERNLMNVHGTFYEVPASNAGGFIKLRPIATHNRRIHDFASYRGLLVMSGLRDDAAGEHILRSKQGSSALWLGAVDDLWQFGKPRGTGGPWKKSPVTANVPSDAYLATGYDSKRLIVSHESGTPVNFRVEADFSATGTWSPVCTLAVPPGAPLEHKFPDAFGAYWLRVVADSETTATATFIYE